MMLKALAIVVGIVVAVTRLIGVISPEVIRGMIKGSYKIDLDSEYWKRETAQRGIVSRLWPESLMS